MKGGHIFTLNSDNTITFNKNKNKTIHDILDVYIRILTLDHINKGGHYVYFESDYEEASFLTTYNFQTQFGREVVFNVELKQNKKFGKEVKKIKKNNEHLEVWRWQNCMFEKNIIFTMKSAKKTLNEFKLEFKDEFKKFNLKIV